MEALKDFGRRVQFSVFECDVDGAGLEELSTRLAREIDGGEDSVRVYRICGGCFEVMAVLGKGDKYEKKAYFIV